MAFFYFSTIIICVSSLNPVAILLFYLLHVCTCSCCYCAVSNFHVLIMK